MVIIDPYDEGRNAWERFGSRGIKVTNPYSKESTPEDYHEFKMGYDEGLIYSLEYE